MRGLYIKSIPFGKGAAGGGITHTIGMIKGFFETDIEMTVITGCGFDIQDDRVINLDVKYNKNGLPFVRDYFYFRRYRKKLKKWLEETKQSFDFVYCRHRSFCDLSLVSSRLLHAYTVLELNDIMHEGVWDLSLYPNMNKSKKIYKPLFYLAGFVLKRIIKHIEEPVINESDKIVVISEQMKETLIQRGYKTKDDILVVPNGVDPNVFYHEESRRQSCRNNLNILPNKTVIGFAGTFGNWHGIPELTQAIRHIATMDNTSFLLMGDGLLKKQMEHDLQSFNNVIFTGLVPFSKMPEYLDACDILIISNSWDPMFNKPFFGSPTKLFEYMAMGKAIVASRLEQINEILTDGISAIMFDPGDISGMEEALRKLIDSPDLRNIIGNNARECVIQEHTWTGNAVKILNAIKKEIKKESVNQ